MALTAAKLFHTIFGNKQFGCYKITGDGATKTWAAPIHDMEAAWFQEGTDTESSVDNLITFSGSTITWNSAIDSSAYGYAYYIGV